MVLLAFLHSDPIMVVAAPTEELHVCISGPPTCDFGSIQDAVDSANPGTLIKIAAGSYTGINNYGGLRQVLYINKLVYLRGGYTIADWSHSDPITNPTIIDAQGLGRVVYITGNISPTLQGLHFTGGDATGLGVFLDAEADVGGGIYIFGATPTIVECIIENNIASSESDGRGGGLFLFHGDAKVYDTLFVSNTASTAYYGWGGGVYLYESSILISGDTFTDNTASTAWNGYGGGLSLYVSDAVIQDNKFTQNLASSASEGRGGGLYLQESDAIVYNNIFSNNTASSAYFGWGGGVGIFRSNANLENNFVQKNMASSNDNGRGGGISVRSSNTTLLRNIVISNTASFSSTADGWGGGFWINTGDAFTLTNNLVAGNQANSEGNGLWVSGSFDNPTTGYLRHNTIANNSIPELSFGSGQGVYVGEYTTLSFSNTILAGNPTVGIYVDTGAMANLEATLWHDNNLLTDGGGAVITGSVNVFDDPAFVNPANWDFHLSLGSAAIDSGIDAGVFNDIDGEGRPNGDGYDIGADEYNQRPVADAGMDQVVDTQAQVTLDGSNSVDPDNGYPLTYRWIQTSGIDVNFVPTISITTFTAPSDPSVLSFSLLVTDVHGATDITPDEVVITVNNQPPIPDAGDDQDVNTNSPVVLDGSGSSDPDDDYPLTYFWTQIEGPAVMLNDVMSESPTFTSPSDPADLTFGLIVTDSLDLSGSISDVVIITVRNQPPVAIAGPDQRVDNNVEVTLDGSGSSDPDDDYPLSFLWTQVGGLAVTLDDNTSEMPSFTAPSDSTIINFNLTVTDSLGLGALFPDQVKIYVGNQPPIADAGADQSVLTLGVVTLDGSGSSDPEDNYPLSYFWTQTDGSMVVLSDATSETPIFTAPSDPGEITFSLMVTDSLGMASLSTDSVVITINNQPPIADAGSDQNVSMFALVTLYGGGSVDPDNDYPLTYYWMQIGGPEVALDNPSLEAPSFTAPGYPTVLTFSLTVADSLGLYGLTPDNVVVFVDQSRVLLPLVLK